MSLRRVIYVPSAREQAKLNAQNVEEEELWKVQTSISVRGLKKDAGSVVDVDITRFGVNHQNRMFIEALEK